MICLSGYVYLVCLSGYVYLVLFMELIFRQINIICIKHFISSDSENEQSCSFLVAVKAML